MRRLTVSTITHCLNHSILRPLVHFCNSLPSEGIKKLQIFSIFKRIALVFLAFCSVALWATPVAAAFPNLIAYYAFDETSGTTAHDAIGSVDGTLQGGAMFAPGAGIRGGAIMLNQATGDLVNMGDHFGFTSGSFSIETWVRLNPGDTNSSVPVGKHFSRIIAGYFLAINDVGDGCSAIGSAHFYVAYPCSGVSSIVVNDGQWHQLVGVYNSTNQTTSIYVDGQFQSSSVGGNIVYPIIVCSI